MVLAFLIVFFISSNFSGLISATFLELEPCKQLLICVLLSSTNKVQSINESCLKKVYSVEFIGILKF